MTFDNTTELSVLERAVESGDPGATCELGWRFEHGKGGVEKDERRAFKLYLRAAELDDPVALNQVGLCYSDGIGVKRDRATACRYYRKSAERGLCAEGYSAHRSHSRGKSRAKPGGETAPQA